MVAWSSRESGWRPQWSKSADLTAGSAGGASGPGFLGRGRSCTPLRFPTLLLGASTDITCDDLEGPLESCPQVP